MRERLTCPGLEANTAKSTISIDSKLFVFDRVVKIHG
jgi:hypothetical protein